MMEYNTRLEMIKNLVTPGCVIAEIGVFQGMFLKQLVETVNPSVIVGIDLFSGVCGSGDQDGNDFISVSLDDIYKELIEYSTENPNVRIVKGSSFDVLSKFPDNYFDMIYIDGDHTYTGCKKDIVASHSKVKPNGWIMGHDYEMNILKAKTMWTFGVNQAVNEFCREFNQTIYAKGNDGCVSYAIKNIK